MISFKKINLNTLLIVSLIVFVMLYLKQCGSTYNLKESLAISNNNEIALSDSISYYQSKNKSLVYEKSILISSKKELKDLNNSLYSEIKNLKANPKIIIEEKVVVIHDTVETDVDVISTDMGNTILAWKHDTVYSDNNYQRLGGEISMYIDSLGCKVTNPVSKIISNEIGISLTTALVKENDSYRILVNSEYPNFNIIDIQGAIVDKKMISSNESTWVIGPSIGYGMVFSSNGSIYHGVQFGIGMTYNLNKQIKGAFRKGAWLK